MKSSPLGVTRLPKSKCVMARVMRQGKRHQKNFTLKDYGTWEKATRAANAWVRSMRSKLPPTNRRSIVTLRNQSGYPGVRLATTRVMRYKKVHRYHRWVANWPGCRNNSGISFSVLGLGDKPAFLMAVLSHQIVNAGEKPVRKKGRNKSGTRLRKVRVYGHGTMGAGAS